MSIDSGFFVSFGVYNKSIRAFSVRKSEENSPLFKYVESQWCEISTLGPARKLIRMLFTLSIPMQDLTCFKWITEWKIAVQGWFLYFRVNWRA